MLIDAHIHLDQYQDNDIPSLLEEAEYVIAVSMNLASCEKTWMLSKRPATIKQEIIVPFARPRQEEIRHSETFTALKQQLFTFLKEEKDDIHVD